MRSMDAGGDKADGTSRGPGAADGVTNGESFACARGTPSPRLDIYTRTTVDANPKLDVF